MKTVLAYLRPYRRRMAAGFTVKVIATLTELLLPYILSHILKNVVAFQGIPQILLWGGAMVVFAAIGMVGNIVANRMAERVTVTFSENLRRDLFARTLRLSAAQTDRFTVASLESRITTDTYHVHRFIGMVQRIGVRAPILLIGGIAVTMIMDPFLSMIMVAMLPPIFLIVYTVSRLGVPLYTRVQDSVDRMVRVVREDIAGIRVIKALSKNDYENRRYDATNRALSHDERVAGAVTGIVNPVMTLLMNCGIVAVIAVSANRVAGHQSDPETVIAFMQYFTMISMSMMTLSRIFLMFSKCSASAKRIEEVLISPEEQETLPLRQAPDPRPVHLSMKNVSFAYGGGGRRLKNVSFELMRGQRLGIIGATGSGKSTLIRLLMRFYDATEGTVSIGGRDVRTYTPEERTAMFGVALQNDFLYADTVEENIRFGRSISPEEIRRAARIAQAADFIEALDGGYSYRLAPKGTNLSGGQRQRLLIARALAGSPEILILDDSSSALDYKTDAALRRALAEELTNTTTVTVAQRVSSVKDCDLILVLEEGEIIGRGTHEELMESCPIYREISDSQMGGAFVE